MNHLMTEPVMLDGYPVHDLVGPIRKTAHAEGLRKMTAAVPAPARVPAA